MELSWDTRRTRGELPGAQGSLDYFHLIRSSIITSCGPEAALFLKHAVVLQSHESYAIYNMTVCEV